MLGTIWTFNRGRHFNREGMEQHGGIRVTGPDRVCRAGGEGACLAQQWTKVADPPAPEHMPLSMHAVCAWVLTS